MLRANPPEIVLPVPAVGTQRIQRLAALATRVRLTTVVSDLSSAGQLDAALRAAGAQVGVFFELDTGYRRCGLSLADVRRLALQVVELKSLEIQGLMTYEGHVYEATRQVHDRARGAYDRIEEAAAELRAVGVIANG